MATTTTDLLARELRKDFQPQPEYKFKGIRSIVSELIIYDSGDPDFDEIATDSVNSAPYRAWTVAAEGVPDILGMTRKLIEYMDIEQLTILVHGHPGGFDFTSGNMINAKCLNLIGVPDRLFRGPGRLLFLSCEIARTACGENFLIAAGRHFFRGKGGIVGGTTAVNRGRDPLLLVDATTGSGKRVLGELVLFRLDAKGNVIGSKRIIPHGL